MTTFLNDERRAKLTAALCGLQMPAFAANIIASYSEDEIDERMARHAAGAAKWVDGLEKAHAADDEEKRDMYSSYILADVLIMNIYKEEAIARGHAEADFPKWKEAIQDGMVLVERVKARLMGKDITIN